MTSEIDGKIAGELHVLIAFDWGGEIDLKQAGALGFKLVKPPAVRRPTSPFTYTASPLNFELENRIMDIPELGVVSMRGKVTIFDFAAVSLDIAIPFHLAQAALTRLAGHLADPKPFIEMARAWLKPLHERLHAAIRDPEWSELTEEFFVFVFEPRKPPEFIAALLQEHAWWVAGLVRLESESLSMEEEMEALRMRLRYGQQDVVILDWAAAVIVDRDCEDTLRTLAFANLHLLELRHIDRRLEHRLAAAQQLVSRQALLPDFIIAPSRSLRAIGMLRLEATGLFERSGDALKLIGDQYLARIYGMIAARFHMSEWEQAVLRTLEVVEDISQVLSDQVAARRGTILETTIVILIVIEIVLGLFH
jgi:hypothetical protein